MSEFNLEGLSKYNEKDKDYLLYCIKVANHENYTPNPKYDEDIDRIAKAWHLFSKDLAAWAIVSCLVKPSRKEDA